MRDRPTGWPASRRMWVLIFGMLIFQVVLSIATRVMLPGPGSLRGQDFMAFYNAARLTLEGRAAELYDLPTIRASQATIVAEAGIAPGRQDFAPFLNPPHAALIFCPLAATMGLRAALAAWTALSIGCLATAAWILSRLVGEVSPLRRHRWLCVAGVALAPTAWTALSIGQNTPLSLMLLTLAVAAWRGGRPARAGLVCAALAYKPQLAAIVALGCWLTMGRRVLLGLGAGGAVIAAATLLLMPGAIEAYVTRMPANFREIFFDRKFPWQHNVTIGGFLRHLIHGNGPGPNPAWLTALAAALVASIFAATCLATWRLRAAISRGDTLARDRLIALLILATPLLMPYFIDYDLTLLLVAGAIVGRAALADGVDPRGLQIAGMALYGWTLFNLLVAEVGGISVTTPLLIVVFALHARRCCVVDRRSRDVTSTMRLAPARAVAA